MKLVAMVSIEVFKILDLRVARSVDRDIYSISNTKTCILAQGKNFHTTVRQFYEISPELYFKKLQVEKK